MMVREVGGKWRTEHKVGTLSLLWVETGLDVFPTLLIELSVSVPVILAVLPSPPPPLQACMAYRLSSGGASQ